VGGLNGIGSPYADLVPTIWNRDPDDGFLCWVSTRRVLDRWGNCCDYNRCRVYGSYEGGKVGPRCLLDIGHAGPCHLGTCWAPRRPWTPTGSESFDVSLDRSRFRPLRSASIR
jgi:hypothetical protein